MSTATAHLVQEFDRLPPEEQREFSAVIVRRASQFDYGEITDEELIASAARVFAMFDEEEDARRLVTAKNHSGSEPKSSGGSSA